MPAHDANNATWYVLRYAEDFGAKQEPEAPFRKPSSPYLDPSLLYDERRGVLELQPEPSEFAADPPPGIALDIDGDIYCVSRIGLQACPAREARPPCESPLLVIRCDGSSVPLPCEANILAQPAGLALDRRGYLYIADPPAQRVVVLNPEDSAVVAILTGCGPVPPLEEPIDVAVSPTGFIYVADRAGGRIAIFSAGMKPLAAFPTAAAPGKPPRPIAIMISADGNLLVADAWLPRLLQYAPGGTSLADIELSTLVAPLAGGALASGAFGRAYGARMPLFLVGNCGPCAAHANDGGARLAEVHRALRLLALVLGRRFVKKGVFISRALDGGRPSVPWHRVSVELNRDPPPGTRVLVETFTSNSATPPPPVPEAWAAPHDAAGSLIPFTTDPPEQLVQSPRGRFLWLRVTLESLEGLGTPSVRAIRAWHPRVSYLDLLPGVYRRDPESAWFLEHFLALFEHVFTGVEDRYEEFSRELNPDAAPREVIDWLAALIDLAFDPSWSLEGRRALVGEAISLYRTRGTIGGLARYVEIYTGRRPKIIEGWLERPARPPFLGRPGIVLGCGLPILGRGPSPAVVPDVDLWARYAHRFTIFVYVDDPCDAEVTLRAVDRIVEVNKPAHTSHRSVAVLPEARVGMQSRVGLDLVVGAATAPGVFVGQAGRPIQTAERSGVLGMDTVLGARRPEYVRRLEGAF
jgi:phage tail-like protein